MDDAMHLGPDLVGDYAEGLLAPAARREADAHLADCEACRRDLAAAQAYFQDLAGLPLHRAPDQFLTRVHGRIAKASPWRRLLAWLSLPRLLPVPIAALSVMIIAVYYTYVARNAEQTPTQVSYAPAKPEPAPIPEKAPITQAALRKDKQKALSDKAGPGVGDVDGRTLAETKADKADQARAKPAARPRSEVLASRRDEPKDMESLKEDVYAEAGIKAEREVTASKRLSGSGPGTQEMDQTTASVERLEVAPSPKKSDGRALDRGAGGIAANAGVVGKAAAEVPAPAPSRAEDQVLTPSSRPAAQAERIVHYSLTLSAGKADAEGFRKALKSRGIEANPLGEDEKDLWTLILPGGSLADLETYLGSLGDFRVLVAPWPKASGGSPRRLTARILFK